MNAVGRGAWSPASDPLRTTFTTMNMPLERALANPHDPDMEEAGDILVAMPPLNLVRENSAKGTTGLTPRLEDGTDSLRVTRFQVRARGRQTRRAAPTATAEWQRGRQSGRPD